MTEWKLCWLLLLLLFLTSSVGPGLGMFKVDRRLMRTKRQVRSRSEVCLGKEDNVLHTVEEDCTKYVLCTGDYEYVASCPTGLFYDPELEACNFDEGGACQAKMRQKKMPPLMTTFGLDTGSDSNNLGSNQNSLTLATPTSGVSLASFCTNRPDGTYADPNRCDQYVLCANSQPHIRQCPAGLLYRTDTNSCDFDHDGRCKTATGGASNTQGGGLTSTLGIPSGDMTARAQAMMPEAVEKAMSNLMQKLSNESQMAQKAPSSGTIHGLFARPSLERDKPFRLVQSLQRGKPIVQQLSMNEFILEDSVDQVLQSLGMQTNVAGMNLMSNVNSPLSPNTVTLQGDDRIPKVDPTTCPYNRYTCQLSKYRTFDGSCNNLQNPLWGRAFTPLKRNLFSQYGDGIGKLRRAKDGSELPSPRLVSFSTLPDKDVPHHIHTVMLMQWGQFMDHDFSLTAITKIPENPDGTGRMVDLECGDTGCATDHPACVPILVPANDPDFRSKRCLQFVRSIPVPNADCKIGPREQLNQLTSYIDASEIYGSTKEEAEKIREQDETRGRLKESPHPTNPRLKKLLPTSDEDDMCMERQPTCYLAGDERVNEQTALTALHVIWLREHNRIEAELHRVNPQWDGETLYQETRKIIGALQQQIIYGEFAPVVLGPIVMKKYGLLLLEDGFYTGYDSSVDASVSNVFATAAFRFGHSMLTPVFKQLNAGYKDLSQTDLSEMFFRPSKMLETATGGVDGFLRGICSSRIQTVDRFITKQVTSKLFSDNPPAGLGTDLASLNIQRARDHGIPDYNAWRVWCGLSKANTFDDLKEVNPNVVAAFKQLYKSVDDIDLFPAGLAEKPVEGSLLGPTFSCILAREFARLRKGDRFWYENRGQFTPDQLKEIRKIKLSKVICNNGDNITHIQPSVMEVPFREAYPNRDLFTGARDGLQVEWLLQLWSDNYNHRQECSCLPGADFSKWRA